MCWVHFVNILQKRYVFQLMPKHVETQCWVALSGSEFQVDGPVTAKHRRPKLLVSRAQQEVYCCPCGVGQATCSEGGLDIASNMGLEGDRVTDLCGTARLGGQVCLQEVWHGMTVKPWNLLLQPLMLGQSDLLAVHWLSLYKHARIQRIAMVSPVLVQSSFESIQWWSRHHLTW